MNVRPSCLRNCYVALALAASLSQVASCADFPFQQFVVFGDSLSDSGNSYAYHSGGYPSPDQGYTAGRTTNGPDVTPTTAYSGVWVEQLAASSLTSAVSSTQSLANGGQNSAFVGAQTGQSVSNSAAQAPEAPTLSQQLSTYLSGTHNTVAADTLYIFWGGTNDLLDAVEAHPALNANTAATQAASNISGQVSQLASLGATDFLVLNLMPLDKSPRGSSHAAALNSSTQLFNSSLSTELGGIETNYPGIKLTEVDIYSLYESVIANPSQYGFTNVTGRGDSATDPDTYLFWDNLHPTTATHNLIARTAYDSLSATYAGNVGTVPEPTSTLLFAGGGAILIALGLRRKWRRI